MNKQFQVLFIIQEINPTLEEFPFNVTNVVRFINMHLPKGDYCVSVTVKAKSKLPAISSARIQLESFLDLYALVGFRNFQIKSHLESPEKSVKLEKANSVSQLKSARSNKNKKIIKKFYSEYWPIINQVENEYLTIALYFFRSVTSTINPIREITDGVVVLEALYSTRDERTEMKYRLSSRIPTLLSSDFKRRKNMIKEIRRLYNARSAIIHGSELSKITNNWPIENWLRESLFRILELSRRYQDHGKIMEKIDEAMMENIIRDKLRKQSNRLVIMSEQIQTTQ